MSFELSQHKNNRIITTLVENKTTYQSAYAEMHVFETHQKAENVYLKFDTPIIASMITGKKIMHLNGVDAFDFFPGESLVLPSNEQMIIDFPLAKNDNPTACLALSIDSDKIGDVVSNFNESVQIENENNQWDLTNVSAHLKNQQEVNMLIERMLATFIQSSKSQDVLLDLMIKELIIRLLQTKAKQSILADLTGVFNDTRIGTVINYIKDNLTDKQLNVDVLADQAYMSASHFHKKFKETLGESPIAYINNERIKFSKWLMKHNLQMQISEVAYKSGFNSVNYFIRQFKRMELISPYQYKKALIDGLK